MLWQSLNVILISSSDLTRSTSILYQRLYRYFVRTTLIVHSVPRMDYFRKKPDPKQLAREQKRELRKVDRELDRETRSMDRQEQQLIADIKRHAKKGDQSTANTLAKQLVRLRNQRTKTTIAKSRLQGVGTQATAMQSQARIAQSMGTAAKVVSSMNKQMNVQQVQETMRKFEEESTKMDLAGEMMDSALDSMFDEEGDEEEMQDIINEVVDGITVDREGEFSALGGVPKNRVQPMDAVASDPDADLERRLAALTGGA
eukprot:m.1315975 g.1315975  ORF g.1315975 m.1315975 type:complete len:258 (+) comp24837_c1_seq4:3157-3930(+)